MQITNHEAFHRPTHARALTVGIFLPGHGQWLASLSFMSWDRLLHPDQIKAEEPKEKRTNLDSPVAADAEDEVMADAEPTKETAAPAERDVVFSGLVYLK
jgi:hypothetical protein